MDKFTYFWCLIIVSMTFFLIGMYRNFAVKIGYILWANNSRQNDNSLGWRQNLKRMFPIAGRKTFVNEAVFQRRIMNRSGFLWMRHSLIFFGFIIIFALDLFLTFAGHYAHHYFHYNYFLEGAGKAFLKIGMELSGAVLFVGLTLGIFHRLIYARREKTYIDLKLLIMLWLVTATGFASEAVRLAAQPNDSLIAFSFLSGPAAQWLREATAWDWALLENWIWSIHATLAAVFFAYIPYSKFVHMIAAPLGRSITQDGRYAQQKRQRISEGLL